MFGGKYGGPLGRVQHPSMRGQGRGPGVKIIRQWKVFPFQCRNFKLKGDGKVVDLTKYRMEIEYIISALNELKSGNYYEKNNSPGSPSAATIAKDIEEMFCKLLSKIANNEPGFIKQIFNVDM